MIPASQAVNLHNVSVSNLDEEEFFSLIQDFLEHSKQRIIFFANAHVLNVANRDPDLLVALNGADLVLADGIGLQIAGRMLGHSIKANLNGTDLLPKVLSLAAKDNKKLFFLGGEPGVAEKAKSELEKMLPGLSVAGLHHGFFKQDEVEEIIAKINESKSEILFVAMGVPLQEEWIWKFRDRLEAKLLFGVGAYLDFSAGRFPRAPFFIRRIGLEWLFRFYQEPVRLFGRYMIGNITFLVRTFRQCLGFYI